MQYRLPQGEVEYYQTFQPDAAQVAAGLQRFMLRVYGYMAFALILTTAVAVVVYNMAVTQNPAGAASGYVIAGEEVYLTSFGNAIYTSFLRWVIMLAPLGMIFFVGARLWAMSPGAAQMTLWIFAGLMGLSLSSIFLIYPNTAIFQTAGVAGLMFAGMSIYGYTTKRDLSQFGSYLMMALFGLIGAMIINIFVGWETLSLLISIVGIVIFLGLTAYDTNRIKNAFGAVMADEAMATRLAVNGALSLYLSFINLFLLLLSLMGGRR